MYDNIQGKVRISYVLCIIVHNTYDITYTTSFQHSTTYDILHVQYIVWYIMIVYPLYECIVTIVCHTLVFFHRRR